MPRVEIAGGHGHDVYHVAISVTSGTTSLVAAVPFKRIKVYNYAVVATAAGTVRFSDGSNLTGTMSFADKGGIACPGGASEIWFQTAAGSALSIVTSGAVEGHLSYVLSS